MSNKNNIVPYKRATYGVTQFGNDAAIVICGINSSKSHPLFDKCPTENELHDLHTRQQMVGMNVEAHSLKHPLYMLTTGRGGNKGCSFVMVYSKHANTSQLNINSITIDPSCTLDIEISNVHLAYDRQHKLQSKASSYPTYRDVLDYTEPLCEAISHDGNVKKTQYITIPAIPSIADQDEIVTQSSRVNQEDEDTSGEDDASTVILDMNEMDSSSTPTILRQRSSLQINVKTDEVDIGTDDTTTGSIDVFVKSLPSPVYPKIAGHKRNRRDSEASTDDETTNGSSSSHKRYHSDTEIDYNAGNSSDDESIERAQKLLKRSSTEGTLYNKVNKYHELQKLFGDDVNVKAEVSPMKQHYVELESAGNSPLIYDYQNDSNVLSDVESVMSSATSPSHATSWYEDTIQWY